MRFLGIDFDRSKILIDPDFLCKIVASEFPDFTNYVLTHTQYALSKVKKYKDTPQQIKNYLISEGLMLA